LPVYLSTALIAYSSCNKLINVDVAQVEAFLAVVRRRGFTRASSDLHLSQPAISRRIHMLEAELQTQLFERIGTRVVLSEAGRTFLPHAESVVASMRDGINAVAALRGGHSGSVTLAVVGTLASSTLTDHLRRFRGANPDIDLQLQTALSAEVSALVRRGDAALGLRYGPDSRPDLACSTIHQEELIAVCSADHPLARTECVEPDSLLGERWLTFPSRSGAPREPYASVLSQRLAAAGLGGADVLLIDSLTAQKRMVEAGFGLAMLPASSVEEELRAGTLCVLQADALRATIPIVLVKRRTAFQSGGAMALAATLSAWGGHTQDVE
jgi:DNA-binding transcriptional LysR family regulator